MSQAKSPATSHAADDITAFPPRGLTYFWFLNDHCPMPEMRRRIGEFAAGGVKSIVLHPREGLLFPYGSEAWFAFIRELTDACVEAGMQVWLYDEDPYPSGSAGGWLVSEHPEWATRGIQRFQADDALKPDELFIFPTGKLLWAGLVSDEAGKGPIDLTNQVGMIRRMWEAAPWNSRWYYPATPLYDCPRTSVTHPEFAMHTPSVPAGYRLVSFVARQIGQESEWGHLADSLNPEATKAFLAFTHDRYAKTLGDRLGSVIPAIFTDEPKFHDSRPYTPGMFEAFQQEFGYDIRPRLEHLFLASPDPQVMLTRLHFRQWCGARFEKAWLKPIADWCKQHKVALVGHISPEDDLVQQAHCLGNLMPLQRHLSLAGIDLIIPAVGDREHPIINVGPVSAVACAQQMNKPGVMSETLGASGDTITGRDAAKILAWQTVMGVGVIVVHAAFQTRLGIRRHDAGPSYGPDSRRWEAMCQTDQALRPFIETVNDSTQIAPVAVVWPIRTFAAESLAWENDDSGRRGEFNELILRCLEKQIGVHIIDEAVLQEARLEKNKLVVGRASYEAILLPSMSMLAAPTLQKLDQAKNAGLRVLSFGEAPKYMQNDRSLEPVESQPWDLGDAANLPDGLPQLETFDEGASVDMRVTRWQVGDGVRTLAMNIGKSTHAVTVAGVALDVKPFEAVAIEEKAGSSSILARFDSQSVAEDAAEPEEISLDGWQYRFDGEQWTSVAFPQATYMLRPLMRNAKEMITFMLSGVSAVGADPVADALEYETTFEWADAGQKPVLSLEPTALQGQVTVNLGPRQWTYRLSDVDVKAIEIDLSEAVKVGTNRISFRFEKPDLNDGIRWPPAIRLM